MTRRALSRTRLALTSATLICVLTPALASAETLVRLFNVGQGDGIIIYCPVSNAHDAAQLHRTHKILIDLGSTERRESLLTPAVDITGTPISAPAARNVLIENVKRALTNSSGARAVDELIITHADADHYNLLPNLLDDGLQIRGGCDPDHVRGRTSWRCLAA
jgi:beta-lactamase superfamily II metal-dependent hydrolase